MVTEAEEGEDVIRAEVGDEVNGLALEDADGHAHGGALRLKHSLLDGLALKDASGPSLGDELGLKLGAANLGLGWRWRYQRAGMKEHCTYKTGNGRS